MTPEASSRRTRSSEARGESPTACASFWTVERPSRWSAARILTSMRSSAGGRLAAMVVFNQLGLSAMVVVPAEAGTHRATHPGLWDTGFPLARERHRKNGLVERVVLHRHRVVEREPAA